MMTEVKACQRCGVEKPLQDFPINRPMKDGRLNECRPCRNTRMRARYAENPDRMNQYQKKWRQENPEAAARQSRNTSLKRKYGITLAEYEEMLLAQGGRCAICGTDNPRGNGGMKVDHDHQTGQVRGLLCANCNTGVGMFGDSIQNLEGAIAYLSAHNVVRFDGDDD